MLREFAQSVYILPCAGQSAGCHVTYGRMMVVGRQSRFIRPARPMLGWGDASLLCCHTVSCVEAGRQFHRHTACTVV